MSFKFTNISYNKPALFLSQYYFLANVSKPDQSILYSVEVTNQNMPLPASYT